MEVITHPSLYRLVVNTNNVIFRISFSLLDQIPIGWKLIPSDGEFYKEDGSLQDKFCALHRIVQLSDFNRFRDTEWLTRHERQYWKRKFNSL